VLRAAIAVLPLAVALAACGGAGAPEPAPPPPPPVAEPPSPPPAEPPATETEPRAGEPQPPEDAELPAAVAQTREAILTAARARDYEGLEALLDPATFSYSFGESGDPVGYWQELESEGHVPIFGDIIPLVLSTAFEELDGIYVWPGAAAKEPSDWTEEDVDSMRVFFTDEEIESFREFGGYLGWRIGIREDGTWLYFVSGD
jgi:hypothetical protein